MSKAQHTPGPWIWRYVNPQSQLQTVSVQEIYADRGEHIYEMVAYTTSNIFGSDTRIGKASANARLIAAAPELLDELDALVRRLARHYPGFETTSARAAIAKAKGE